MSESEESLRIRVVICVSLGSSDNGGVVRRHRDWTGGYPVVPQPTAKRSLPEALPKFAVQLAVSDCAGTLGHDRNQI